MDLIVKNVAWVQTEVELANVLASAQPTDRLTQVKAPN